MAHSLSARKRARQAGKRRLHNASARSMFRTQVRKVLRAIQAGDQESARKAYGDAVAVIDKTANKGLIHKNKAARHKSRLSKRIREMA